MNYIIIIAIIALKICIAQSPLHAADNNTSIPDRAEDICPIQIGQALPHVVLKTSDNQPFDLNGAVAEKPTILIFYRGGWCMYCNMQLGQLQSIESDIIELGYQIIAVSPDRPELLKKHADEKGIKYLILSDSDMTAAKSFGIAFKLDEAIVTKYRSSYGIDVEGDSDHKHHLLPVPSVFLIGTDGVILFSYVNPNYKVRIDPDLLLKAAEVNVKK